MQKNLSRIQLSAHLFKRISEKIIILGIFFAGFSSQVFAQELSGYLLVSTSKLQSQLEKKINNEKPYQGVFVDKISFEGPFPIELSNVTYSFDWNTSRFQNIEDKNVQFVFNKVKLQVIVPQIKIDTNIVQLINGVLVKVRVNSTCENVNLLTESEIVQVNAEISDDATETHISLRSKINNLQYSTPRLTVGKFKCDNIQGFEDLVSDQIRQQFSQIDFYKPIIIEKINRALDSELILASQKIENLVKNQIQNTSLTGLQFKLAKINSKHLTIQFSTAADEMIAASAEEAYDAGTDAVLVIDKTMLQNFLKQRVNQKLRQSQFSSKKIPDLDKLTKSRFKQFFVWPALMKRPKGAELILQPMIEKLEFLLKTETVTQVLKINATGGLWIIDQSKPMVYLRSQMQVNTSIRESTAIQSDLTSIRTSPLWDKKYLAEKNCSQRISTSIVDSVAKQYFTDNWANKNLNLLKITDEKSAKIKNMYLDKANKIYFGINLTN